MRDLGYSLQSIELLNWGNFHGRHEVTFKSPSESGPLFQLPPASAILGVNGSGKSTLIDGLMMVLLPFERSLKLGVTHDAESGGSGGRTVKDYVLGKYSSTGNMSVRDLSEVFGRKDGMSLFLIRFFHNQNPQKKITLGRAWWYQGHKVSDQQCAMIIHDDLRIADLCPGNLPPKNFKQMKEQMKPTKPHLVFFDTMSTYFSTMSLAFGGMTKDDLRILNNAFYVKSISHIDDFIRQNMLVESESPHLDRLLENVKNGSEIAFSIESCEKRISTIQKILKQIRKISENLDQRSQIEIDKKISSIYKIWSRIQDFVQDLAKQKKIISENEIALPQVIIEISASENQIRSIVTQLQEKNIDQVLHQLKVQKSFLEQKIDLLRKDWEFFCWKVKSASLADCLKAASPFDLRSWFSERFRSGEESLARIHNCLEERRFQKHQMVSQTEDLRKTIDHLAKHQTLIPRELFEIKQRALEELDIPKDHLAFVGELIQIRREHRDKFTKAVESVLFPISRNLLCHPIHLNSLTKWLNKNGFKSDLVVKRISEADMIEFREQLEFEQSSILSLIEILPASKTPFHFYLWKWLDDVFDFHIVDVNEFKSSKDKVVTLEGLVKSDKTTMRKLKQNFSYSLGWDTEEEIQRSLVELKRVQVSLELVEKEIKTKESEEGLVRDQIQICRDYERHSFDFLSLGDEEQRMKSLVLQEEKLLKENPDYKRLKLELKELQEAQNALLQKQASFQVQLQDAQKLEAYLNKVIPEKIQQYKSSETFKILAERMGSEEKVEQEIQSLASRIGDESSHVAFDLELQNRSMEIETKIHRLSTALTLDLNFFSKEYYDPNLPYGLHLDDSLRKFEESWTIALDRLEKTELPESKAKWQKFFDQVLIDSVKDTINEIRSQLDQVKQNIISINEVLKLTNYEELRDEHRYLKISFEASQDDRVRKFLKDVQEVEKVLGPQIRIDKENQSQNVMTVLRSFVEALQKSPQDRLFVTDVRNHFVFQVHSLRRVESGEDVLVEIFIGSKKDAKSSAQTTHLAYTLLASCLAYRFHFHDPIKGKDTLRLLILDEFGGKFDNEKPKEILKLFDKMGFQSILVSPMSKGDLLAGSVSHMIFVFKVNARESKLRYVPIESKQDYEKLVRETQAPSKVLNHAH